MTKSASVLSLLLAPVLALAARLEVGTFRIELATRMPTIVAGQPLHLELSWHAASTAYVVPEITEILISNGGAFVPFEGLRAGGGSANFIAVPTSLRPGSVFRSSVLIAAGQSPAGPFVPFTRPGTYRVKARESDVESNELVITVVSPTPSDVTILDAFLGHPEILSLRVLSDDALRAEAARLVRDFPSSPYVQQLRLWLWGYRLREARTQDDHSNVPPEQGMTSQVLDEIQQANVGVYEPQRLALLALSSVQFRDEERARQAYTAALRDFPNTAIAQEAAKWLGVQDATEPTLNLVSSPPVLWPPNHKLVAIAVAVNVSDNVDANPVVKLISITCDDACNPAQDIVEAAFGTDDRAFKLRADRTGGGSGRTYTITYEATDAAGNKATATTTVIVPHDKRLWLRRRLGHTFP